MMALPPPPRSLSKPTQLGLPDLPLKRLSDLSIQPLGSSQSDDERWSIPILLAADDDGDDGAGLATEQDHAPKPGQSPLQWTVETPRQELSFPADISPEGSSAVASIGSREGEALCPPRNPLLIRPRTPEHGQTTSSTVDRKLSDSSSSFGEGSLWSSVGSWRSEVDSSERFASGPFARGRHHRIARGPEDDLWRRYAAPLSPTRNGLFDPAYAFGRPGSPMDEENDEEEQLIERCPSPLDSTHMTILSRPPDKPRKPRFHSEMARSESSKGELRVVLWIEKQDGYRYITSLGFTQYSPPTHLQPSPAEQHTASDTRFAQTGSVEYGKTERSLKPWEVETDRSGVPSTLTLKKVTLSDDDQLDYIHSSTSSPDAHELPLDRNGRFVVGEEDDDLLQWSLEYEVGDDSCSREKIVTPVVFRCDPNLLDRSQGITLAKPTKSGRPFRFRLGSGSDASSRPHLPTPNAPRRRLFTADAPLLPHHSQASFATSETHLLLNRPPPSVSQRSPSPFGIFKKRSLSALHSTFSTPAPTTLNHLDSQPQLERSRSLRADKPLPPSPIPEFCIKAPPSNRLSAPPLPFLPSPKGNSKIRSSPGVGLPASVVFPISAPAPLDFSKPKRRPSTGSPNRKMPGMTTRAMYLGRRPLTPDSPYH